MESIQKTIIEKGTAISSQEALSDITPIDWSKDVLDGKYKDKTIIKSKDKEEDKLCMNTFIRWIKRKFKITKPRSLFKNDFLGIKRKLYERKMINNLFARNHVKADILSDILDIATYISILYDEEDNDKLKYICEEYDALIEDINYTMNQVKKMIE